MTKEFQPNVTDKWGASIIEIHPAHEEVHHFAFPINNPPSMEELNGAYLEANLADAISRVGTANGLSRNDIQHLFPAILRMLKSKSTWAE